MRGRASNLTLALVVAAIGSFVAGCAGVVASKSDASTNSDPAPSLTTQPSSQTVTVGQTATFAVVATGTAPLSYQWQKNGANVSGATSATYSTPPTTTADNAATFQAVVSNSAGSVTSNRATLTVNPAAAAPTITTQPVNQTVTAGQTATFSVVATGTAPLGYQWQMNGANISGATSASYSTPVTTSAENGATFVVVVSNAVGSVTSNSATLTVSSAAVAPVIQAQPANETVAVGQTATFSVVAGGSAPLSYQWEKNGANISGATTASYTTPVTTAADNGATFVVVVSNAAGSATSNPAKLTVSASAVAPTIAAQPASQTVTAGQTATFSVVANGTAPLAYQWQKNGANIGGATLASYTTPATTSTDNASTFQVVVSNSAGSVTSSAATLTVNPAVVAPTITTQPSNQTVTAGQTATFAVVASGTAPLSYQWQKNGANISGATSASYTTPATTSTDNASTFQVVVSNSAGSLTSSTATLTVNPAVVMPTITTQPSNQTVTAGQTATFAVLASGTAPLSYQWQKNGTNITGATSASYTTPATTSADSGSAFQVIVSNSKGNITSNAVTLTVTAAAVAPTISVQPTNQTITAGQTATFTVVASGTAPLSYQWQKNGANISGATSASYTTPATTSADNGSTFQLLVRQSAGLLRRTGATLTVNPAVVAPTITTQPANQTVTAGQTATFSVVAAGTAPLGYQWQKNGANISGATSASYTTPATTTTDNGSTFQVVVSNSAGSVTSSAATLTVNPAVVAPTITAQPANQTVTAGQTATFAVVASGTAPLSYQWQKNGANISGATSASYTTPATTSTDNASTFHVVVSNSAGSVTSSAATLTVNPAVVAPTITAQPANQTVTAGQTATFAVVASGTAPLSYQWQKNGANISGATSTSYTTPATTSTDNASTFQVVVSNSAGSVTSSAATLTVNPAVVAPTITTQPASQTVTAGQTATFSVVATGTAPLSYQWQKNGANISGATSTSYTTPATTSTDNGSTFQVVVSNSAGSVMSSAATLTVNHAVVAPTNTTQTPSPTETAGQTATFSVVATGTAPLSYQWQKNGANISGATSASYTTPATTSADNGSTFKVVVSNSAGNTTSNAATLTVNTALTGPSITSQQASLTVASGQTVTFTVAATGTAPLSYQWFENGTAISGATSSTYTTPATTTSDNGDVFRVTVSNSVSSVTSNSATLTIVSAELASATVTVTTTGRQIPSDFGGISTDFFDGQSTIPNPLFPQLIKNLTYPGQTFNLNLEGDSSSPPNNPPTNAQIATYKNLYTALQNLGVNLEYTMPVTMCATSNPVTYAEPAVSTYLANAPLPGWIGVTLGNEPDGACNGSGGYAGGYSGFLSNWNNFRTNINALSGASALKFVGPSFGGQQPWVYTSSDLNSFVSGEVSHLTYASQHWYTQNGCTGSPTVAAELSAAAAKPPGFQLCQLRLECPHSRNHAANLGDERH